MKSSNGVARRRRRRTSPKQRLELLAAFEDSGMSAAAFARQQGIGYTTFCGWRHRQAKAPPFPAFVEVEVAAPAAAVEVWIELGAHARLRLTSAAQVELAARFLHHFHALAAC
jgi:transposase-like protein